MMSFYFVFYFVYFGLVCLFFQQPCKRVIWKYVQMSERGSFYTDNMHRSEMETPFSPRLICTLCFLSFPVEWFTVAFTKIIVVYVIGSIALVMLASPGIICIIKNWIIVCENETPLYPAREIATITELSFVGEIKTIKRERMRYFILS